MIMPFAFELHTDDDLTDDERMAARQRASDDECLGIDADLASGWLDAPWPEVVAHLLMFDPAWLFRQRWVGGWTVEPVTADA